MVYGFLMQIYTISVNKQDRIDGDASGEVITPNVNPIVDQGASVTFGSTFKEENFDPPCRTRCRKVTEDGVSPECTFSSLDCRKVQLFVVASDTRGTRNSSADSRHRLLCLRYNNLGSRTHVFQQIPKSTRFDLYSSSLV